MGEDKIQAIFILEILGKPAEHIKKTLTDIVKKLGEEKDVKVISKSVAEPKPFQVKEKISQELFTSFAEIEFETNMQKLMLLVYGYMPSHIDIIKPEDLRVKNSDLNLFLNELTRRLHQYDELARAFIINQQVLAKQIQEGKIKVVKEEPEKGKKTERKSGKTRKQRKKKI